MKRYFYILLFGLVILVLFTMAATPGVAAVIRVVVWDERQPEQKSAYGDFLGNTLAKHLATRPGFTVKSVGLDDPEQGLSDDILDHCDVLIWWGHKRHGDVTPEHVKAVVDRLKAGKLSLVALHSAHWSKPFIGAMNERAVEDALNSKPRAGSPELLSVKVVKIPPPPGLPAKDAPLTPSFRWIAGPSGTDTVEVQLPRCVFPEVLNPGTPSHVTTLLPRHPIAKGIPATFDIPQTEIYGGPFHVPKPDAVVFEERWDSGQTFTSGCAWTVGKGRVFYFRPGHETYAIYNQEIPLKIVENAVRWVDGKK